MKNGHARPLIQGLMILSFACSAVIGPAPARAATTFDITVYNKTGHAVWIRTEWSYTTPFHPWKPHKSFCLSPDESGEDSIDYNYSGPGGDGQLRIIVDVKQNRQVCAGGNETVLTHERTFLVPSGDNAPTPIVFRVIENAGSYRIHCCG